MKEVNCQTEEWRKREQEDKKRKEAWDKEQAARKKEAESRLALPRGREIRLRRPNLGTPGLAPCRSKVPYRFRRI
jgi:hypothetical protein